MVGHWPAQGEYVTIFESTAYTPGTLADNTVGVQAGPTMQHGVHVISSDIYVVVRGTRENDEPCLLMGIGPGTEVNTTGSAYSADGPTHMNDVDSLIYTANRTYPICAINPPDAADGRAFGIYKHRFKLNMTCHEDSAGWVWWFYNQSGAALTSGIVIEIMAKHHCKWGRG